MWFVVRMGAVVARRPWDMNGKHGCSVVFLRDLATKTLMDAWQRWQRSKPISPRRSWCSSCMELEMPMWCWWDGVGMAFGYYFGYLDSYRQSFRLEDLQTGTCLLELLFDSFHILVRSSRVRSQLTGRWHSIQGQPRRLTCSRLVAPMGLAARQLRLVRFGMF